VTPERKPRQSAGGNPGERESRGSRQRVWQWCKQNGAENPGGRESQKMNPENNPEVHPERRCRESRRQRGPNHRDPREKRKQKSIKRENPEQSGRHSSGEVERELRGKL